MSKTVSIFIILNNYLHDLATAFLFVSSIFLYFLLKIKEFSENLNKLKKILRKIFLVSFVIIIIAGIPRTIFLKKIEIHPMIEKNLIIVLIIKHIVLFIFTFFAFLIFLKTRKDK